MTSPQLHFNAEELRLEITGLGGGWTIQNLGEIRLFDYAQVTFPHDWHDFQIQAATRVIEEHWRLNAHVLLDQTLTAGFDYNPVTGAGGGSLALDTELKAHILQRPTVTLDFTATFQLHGSAEAGGSFQGTTTTTLGLSGTF